MKPKLFIISSISGSEKTKIVREVMDNEMISFTTRSKRENELEGKDYYFVSRLEFEQLLKDNQLVEVTNYHGEFYGVTKAEFNIKLSNKAAFWFSNYNGMKQLKRNYENCTTVFIYSDQATAIQNLELRGETDEQIAKKLRQRDLELENLHYYDHVITHKFGALAHVIDDLKDIVFDI